MSACPFKVKRYEQWRQTHGCESRQGSQVVMQDYDRYFTVSIQYYAILRYVSMQMNMINVWINAKVSVMSSSYCSRLP